MIDNILICPMDKEFTAVRNQCRQDRRLFECELDLFQVNEIRALVMKESM